MSGDTLLLYIISMPLATKIGVPRGLGGGNFWIPPSPTCCKGIFLPSYSINSTLSLKIRNGGNDVKRNISKIRQIVAKQNTR